MTVGSFPETRLRRNRADTWTRVRGVIGISPHARGQAWITFGGDGAIAALAAICARHAAGGVKSPGGLLRKMVELHQKGTLWLDRTLFGQADKPKSSRQ